LGFEKKFGYHNQNKLLGFYLEIGNNNFLEFFHDPKIENKASQIKHFCLEVDYIDSMIEKLSIAGIDVTDKKLGKDKIWQC
jgi:hypothetical protein